MRTLYATQFRIDRRVGEGTTDVAGQVGEEVISWMTDRYGAATATKLRAFDGQEHLPRLHHVLRSAVESGNGYALVTLEWRYPHDDDTSLLWHTRCHIAVSGDAIEFSVSTRIGAATFSVRPLEFDLGRPRLIPALLSRFHCYNGVQRLVAEPMNVGIGEVKQFVSDVLMSPARTVPIVIVSTDVWTDKPAVDPARLQDALAGIAVVVFLTSKWAAYELSDCLGPKLSCYDGAVRVYWPGFAGKAVEASKHRLFLAEPIKYHESNGRRLSHYLFRTFAALSAFRFAEGEITRTARSAIESAGRARLQALIEQSRKGDKSGDAELLELALKENQEFALKLNEREEQIASLQRDLATYEENLRAMAQFTSTTEPATPTMPATPSEVHSVAEALKQVAKACDTILVFKSAADAAEQSDFARPEDIKKALLAIANLSNLYFAAKGKQSIGRWEDFFEQRGLKYAPTESQTTTTMYGEERKFIHDGRKVQMFKHLTIGKGDTRNCLQIYFEPNDNTKQFEIGYCGRHLPYAGKGT